MKVFTHEHNIILSLDSGLLPHHSALIQLNLNLNGFREETSHSAFGEAMSEDILELFQVLVGGLAGASPAAAGPVSLYGGVPAIRTTPGPTVNIRIHRLSPQKATPDQ